MADAPGDQGSHAPPGTRPDDAQDAAELARKKSVADLRKRTTAMGLAPAPHLAAGLAGSPGAIARAEQAARRQGVAARLQSTVVGHSPLPMAPAAPAEPAAVQPGVPIDGGRTALMTPESFRKPTPHHYEATLPSSSQWEVADAEVVPAGRAASEAKMPAAAPHVVMESPRTAPFAPPIQPGPRVLEHEEQGPTTERMRAQMPGPSNLPVAPRASQVPAAPPVQTGLALRTYDPFEGHQPMAPHALSGRLDPRLVLLAEPDSARAASFRVLRDRLLDASLPRVLAVSSALPNDGKTTCAVNLALALAESPATKVLLVDGNFFDPELGRIFTLDRLTPLVPSEAWLVPYTIAAVTQSLHVAGIVQQAAIGSPRFEQHRFEAMIDRFCRANYDYIVIDTPALRGTPAVATLLSGADATLLAVRSGSTSVRDLRRAAEQIPEKKALGIALIDAATS